MGDAPGKFCLDQNRIRWSFLNGTIIRKTGDDDPAGGEEVPARNVTAIEKASVKKVERSPIGRFVIVGGAVMVALAWKSESTAARILIGLIGLIALYRGVEMSRAKVSVHEAYRLIIPGKNAEEWQVVGNTSEVIGFVEAVRSEMHG